jgi:Cyclic nucleotide-binding domain
MVLGWIAGSKQAVSVDALIARKKYAQAVELLRAEFQRGSRDPRLRLQLADVLALAGKGRDAVPILLGLADEFAMEGFAAKAISVLKKVQKIDPTRSGVDVKLARLIKEKQRATPAAAAGGLEIGAEEISLDIGVTSTPSEEPVARPEATPAEPPDLDPPGLAELERAASGLGNAEEGEAEAGAGSLNDELLGVIEGVLREGGAAAAAAPRPAAVPDSPLFSDFSPDELVAVIQGLRLLSFEPGDILITEGEAGDSLFVLTEGVVKAFVRNPAGRSVKVREMPEGSFFGEISILSGTPRTATITAASRTELLELDRATLESICTSHPRVREVLQRFYDERVRNEQEARIREGRA